MKNSTNHNPFFVLPEGAQYKQKLLENCKFSCEFKFSCL